MSGFGIHLTGQALSARRTRFCQGRGQQTDANDAEGLTHLVRAGWYKEVRVKSRDAMLSKAVAAARRQLLDISTNLSNEARGLMKTFGLVVPEGNGRIFEANVRWLVDQEHALAAVVPRLSLKLCAPSATVPPSSTGSCSVSARRRKLPTAHDGPRSRRRRRCRLSRCHRVACQLQARARRGGLGRAHAPEVPVGRNGLRWREAYRIV
jgi:hypothetical protein